MSKTSVYRVARSSIQLLFVVEICVVTMKQASATEKKYVIKDIFAKDCWLNLTVPYYASYRIMCP